LTGAVLEKALDGLAQREAVVAMNIAHVDGPGYKARRVHFEAELAQAAREARERSGPRPARLSAVEGVTPQLEQTCGARRRDGNNVSMEDEVADLGRTSLAYQAVARVLGKRLSMLRLAISGGSRH
jgi:flagellar basal-body rod protein FlgB